MSTSAGPSDPVCLILAGYDPSGGGGVLADLRAARACGVRSIAAVTAVTAQNTVELARVDPVTPASLGAQLELLAREFPIGAIKIGMLATAELATVVSGFLGALPPDLTVVLDPVLAATAGPPLFEPERLDALLDLLPRVSLVTPNLPELGLLTGHGTSTAEGRRRGALTLLERGSRAVLVKGGHGDGDLVVDELHTPEGSTTFSHPRRTGPKVRGTGCFLATAIACGLLRGLSMTGAIDAARDRLLDALASSWFPAGRNGLMSDL